jgi:glycine hydroxymethyltransferase
MSSRPAFDFADVQHPAGTTSGFGTAEFRDIADVVADVLEALRDHGEAGNGAIEAQVKTRARELCARFPIYQDL